METRLIGRFQKEFFNRNGGPERQFAKKVSLYNGLQKMIRCRYDNLQKLGQSQPTASKA